MKYSHPLFTVLPLLILFSFVILGISFLSIKRSNAQESSKQEKIKSLRELAQEKDVEVSVPPSETDWETDIDSVARSAETIVVGKITDIATSFDGDHWLRTDYTVDVQQVPRPFTPSLPVEAYSSPPIQFGTTLKVSRSGGAITINEHRIIQNNTGREHLVIGKTFVFFLQWSPSYNAYIPVGGISGLVLVEDNKTKPLAIESKARKANLKYGESELNSFLEEVLKKKIIHPRF